MRILPSGPVESSVGSRLASSRFASCLSCCVHACDVEDDHSGSIHLVLPAARLVQIAGRQ